MPATHEATPLTSTAPGANATRFRKRILLYAAGIASVALVIVLGVVVFKPKNAPVPAAATAHLRASASDTSFTGSADEIHSLPGMPATYSSRLFSGYLPVPNGGEGFYFFAESQSETPENDPVLLWLNGGPGASSLAGFFSENGPLLVNPDGRTLRVNEFGWNKQANMLCIESPVGVGFSYNASHIYKSDDEAQADDLYWMLQSFFDKFPWLRANDFIVSGESYGGVYVPMLAKRIVEGNKEHANDAARAIQLKKFVVGNGVNEYTALSKIAFAYYHALISTADYQSVVAKCPQILTPEKALIDEADEACQEAVGNVLEHFLTVPINNYDITATCSGNPLDGIDALMETLMGPPQAVAHPIALSVSLCLNSTDLSTYFNIPGVRVALHAKPEIAHWNEIALTSANFDLPSLLNISADAAADIIANKALTYSPTLGSVVTPVWKFLLASGVEGFIYHGDTDLACDFIGGLWAVESLKLPRKQARAAWTVDGQVGGFVEDFGAIKYATVRGSGHMVPQDKPKEAKAMLDQFVLVKK